jgi:glycosyltransferase involved in cell wall biosynthesis
LALGIDYRPALQNREGIGRAVRELVRALCAGPRPGPPAERLALFGATLAAPRVPRGELGLADDYARLFRLRVPSRAWRPLRRLTGLGIEHWLGALDGFHHTQLSILPLGTTRQSATIWDGLYLHGGRGYLAPEVARRMERAARELVQRCPRLQVPSAHVAAEVQRELDVEPGRIDLVPLAADHVLRIAPGPARVPNAPFLLTVARIDPRKNHALVLGALEILVAAGSPLHWVLAGPAGYGAEHFWRRLASSPVRARVHWLEFVPEGELVTLYREAAGFVFPSLGEGFGLPPLEAATLGCPVLALATGSLPELLPATALLPPDADAETLAAALRELLDRPRAEAAQAPLHRGTWSDSARAFLDSWRRGAGQPVDRPS